MTDQHSSGSPAPTAARARSAIVPVLLATVLAGCATAPQSSETRSMQVCAAGECSDAGRRYSADRMLHALDRLFQANDGADMALCRADPETRVCSGDDVGYFVMGGILPGRGSSRSGKVSQVRLDAENRSIRYRMSMNLRFLGAPLLCADHGAVLAVNSATDIAMNDDAYMCNWMGVGIMTASFSFVIDSVDLDNGRLGGYWKHGVTGTGYGRGAGYALIQFPRSMPRGENWLTEK